MATIKQLVYRYNGDPNQEENLVDYDDEIPIPKHGDIIQRRGTDWEVVMVNKRIGVSAPKPVDVYQIFLREAKR